MKDMNTYNFLQFDDSDRCRKQMIKSVSRNIRNIRRKKNLTQEQVAEMAGINAKYLGEIERGMKNPTAPVVIKLSQALQVPVCKILSMNHCPHVKDSFLAKVGNLFAGRKDNERQKALKLLEVFFE